MMKKRSEILHKGEQEAQDKYAQGLKWPTFALNEMFKGEFDPRMKRFIEAQRFFFIATAGDTGQCDASFRSTEPGSNGDLQPAVKIFERNKLVFPDYSGNNLFNSIGNILVNPNIGMIFIDFSNATRIRVNGSAEIIEDPKTYSDIWSSAHRYILVTAQQVYWNCPQRIPKLKF